MAKNEVELGAWALSWLNGVICIMSGEQISGISSTVSVVTSDYGAIQVEPFQKSGSLYTEMSELSNPEQFGFGVKFVKRFYFIHRFLFNQAVSPSSALFLLLLCITVLGEYVIYQVGLIPSGYYSALGEKNLNAFWKQTGKSMGLIIAVAFLNSSTEYIYRTLAATFRVLLSEAAHRQYFADVCSYQLNVIDKSMDNPDQRMTQDVERFTRSYCEVLPKLLVSPFTIGYYCYQGYQRSGWQGPVGCFGFFVVATVINKVMMGPIVNFVVKQEKREGDFRFAHMLVRVYSESIAFHDGFTREHDKVNEALSDLVKTQRSLYFRQYFLGFTVQMFDYLGSIFSYLMLAVPIFAGTYDDLTPADLSVLISQNAFILIYLIYTFTKLIDLSPNFADIGGVTHRIAQLFEQMQKLTKERHGDASNQIQCENAYDNWQTLRGSIVEKCYLNNYSPKVKPEPILLPTEQLIWSLNKVSLLRPKTQDVLISDLTMNIVVGESVLISGPSGTGKTSLLRMLRGLWIQSGGLLTRHYPPGPTGVYFCPQQCYRTWGTLREQISFPLRPDKSQLSDTLIIHYLDKLQLSHILKRMNGLDVACCWSKFDSLSPGEMQRLCILRIFYHLPVVAVLDESTSSMSFEMEQFVYSELLRLGITLISAGHRESIRKFHKKEILLKIKADWEIKTIA